MAKKNDLTGKRFGKIRAVKATDKRIGGRVIWICRCDCGNELEVSAKYLLNGSRTKCDRCKAENLVGKRYGLLTVLERDNAIKWQGSCRHAMWKCLCDCGNVVCVSSGHLKSSHTKSCGCLQREIVSEVAKTHGMSGERLHSIWQSMLSRCRDNGSGSFINYGGRGISVCEEWQQDFTCFYKWAMVSGYSDDLYLERINNDGNYEPTNCTWKTYKEQQRNKRTNHLLTFNGKTQTMIEWSEELRINYSTLSARINVAKWSVERALTEPINVAYRRK